MSAAPALAAPGGDAWLSGCASSPDQAAFTPTGDFSITALVDFDDWNLATGGGWVLSHYDATPTASYSWIFGVVNGNLETYVSDATTVYWATSTVGHGLADGGVQWIRTDVDIDNGSAGADYDFYLGGSGATPSWSKLGATVTHTINGVLTIDNSTATLNVGGITQCTSGHTMRVHAATMSDTTGLVVDVDFRNSVTDPDLSTALGADGYTYTESARGDFVVEGLTTVLAGGDSELAAAAAISASIAAFLAGFIVITVAVRD